MGADQNLGWAKAAASALEWWVDAGVDVLVDEAPHDWFAAPAPTQTPLEPPAAGTPLALPATLDAFHRWRGGAEAPEARWVSPVIPAAIVADAPLLVLVDCPEREDRDALWSGPAGQLLSRMLAAIGRSRADTSLAALCWRRPTTGSALRQVAPQLAELARHHVALAAPKRLLVLGDAASRAILATSADEARGSSHALNHKDGSMTSVLASHHPDTLLKRPDMKREAWRDLLLLDERLRL